MAPHTAGVGALVAREAAAAQEAGVGALVAREAAAAQEAQA